MRRVGANCIRPTDVPAGTGSGYIYSAPRGPSNGGVCNTPLHGYREMTLAAGSKSVFSPILGGFWASNRFLAQSSAGLGLQIGFWPNPRRVLGSESVFGAILGGFWASNRFLAQSSPGLGLRIGFWCNPRRVLGFKSVFGAILGGFGASNWFLAQSSAGFGAAGEGRRQRVA